jgi:gliding motility-associated protein GldM
MAGGKESPRQKMIGMMYLVLMAMLALNVSRQVLNAFAVVNGGLKITNHNYDEKNQATYDAFKKADVQDPKKTDFYYQRALAAQKLSKDFCIHIDSLRTRLISVSDDKPWDTAAKISLADVDSKETFDKPTAILINDNAAEDGSKGEAHKLKLMIAAYRKNMLALLKDPKDSFDINIGLLTPDVFNKASGEKENWEIYNFYDSPLAACVVSLTRLQNDIKNAEASVVQKLYSSIDASMVKVDKIEAEVIPKTTYVVVGDSFHAEIFLAASQSTQKPIITIDSINGKPASQDVGANGGTGYYSEKTTAEGPQSFAGIIKIRKPGTDEYSKYPFRSSYLAAKPSVVVSPTQMNVFYIGVPNPISISAAGFANSDLQPSCSGGSLSKAAGGYVVTLPSSAKQGGECSISVSGKMPDGSHKSLGPPQKFRIKRVPDPTCYVANRKGDMNVTRGELSIATQVQARMENFDFNLSYAVTSFEMVVTVNGATVQKSSNSNLFTPEMKTLMNQIGKGSHIIIQNVHVKGPDSRTIPGVNISVN